MDSNQLEQVEQRVTALIEKIGALQRENKELHETLNRNVAERRVFTARLDAMINRLEGV